MKNKHGLMVVALLGVGFIWACGGSSSTSTPGDTTDSDSPSFTSIASLPKATSPMASSASASIAKDFGKAAVTGLNLGSTAASDFGEQSSMAACQTFNVLKDSINSAAQADMILCFVQAMNDNFGSLTNASGSVVNVYDGEWHIFNMNITGSGGAPDKVKMRIVKNAAGKITNFDMFMCKYNNSNVLIQNEYTGQTISGTNFTMSAKGNYADMQWSGSHEVDVTGILDAAGAYESKSITVRNTGGETSGSNTNWQESTLTQTPGEFVVRGYQRGTYSDQSGGAGTYQESGQGKGQLLGDTSATIANLAMGDGAVKVDGRYTWTPQNESDTGGYDPDPDVFAWLGDGAVALENASASDYYSVVSDATVPTPADSVSVSFDVSETWDCSDDAAVAVDLPEQAEAELQTTCSQYELSHEWINCYQQIQPEQ